MRTFFVLIIFISPHLFAQQSNGSYQIAVLKYNGGGDYYANPTSVPNLIAYVNKMFNADIQKDVPYVEANSPQLFSFPFIHMTGHGNVVFSPAEIQNLRNYLLSGGFLHIDDNYGMDQFIRLEIQKLFPDNKLIELPSKHELFKFPNSFPTGLPKIHEHDGKSARAFAIFENGRMVLLYTYETDLGDGWEDAAVHNNPEHIREIALKMGANILYFSLVKGGYESE